MAEAPPPKEDDVTISSSRGDEVQVRWSRPIAHFLAIYTYVFSHYQTMRVDKDGSYKFQGDWKSEQLVLFFVLYHIKRGLESAFLFQYRQPK
jgi:hypothetical protein